MTQTSEDRRVQAIRTYLPTMVAVLVARLVAAVPAIAEGVAFVDGLFAEAGWIGVSVTVIAQAVIVGLVLVVYQRGAQWLGDRWPRIEALMLGSSSRPVYEPRHG